MIAGGNHTLIKEADVAISRYDVCSCTAVRWMVPGDSQEVNCPEGAREATLGCGPNGPRNDSFFHTKTPIDFYLQFAKEWGILGYIASDIKPLAA